MLVDRQSRKTCRRTDEDFTQERASIEDIYVRSDFARLATYCFAETTSNTCFEIPSDRLPGRQSSGRVQRLLACKEELHSGASV